MRRSPRSATNANAPAALLAIAAAALLGGCSFLADEFSTLDVAPQPPREAPAGTDGRP